MALEQLDQLLDTLVSLLVYHVLGVLRIIHRSSCDLIRPIIVLTSLLKSDSVVLAVPFDDKFVETLRKAWRLLSVNHPVTLGSRSVSAGAAIKRLCYASLVLRVENLRVIGEGQVVDLAVILRVDSKVAL